MQVFHVTTRASWEQARHQGSYTMSTRDRTLADEGFVHACHRHQVKSVVRRYWSDLDEPLVLLVVETDRLSVPWSQERVGEETFPHVHGPVDLSAVVGVRPLDRHGVTGSLASFFFREMMSRIVLVLLVMALALAAAALGSRLAWEWAPFASAMLAVVVGGIAIGVRSSRRRG